ncbi:hypothetical protein [Methylobacterium fujisawaense]
MPYSLYQASDAYEVSADMIRRDIRNGDLPTEGRVGNHYVIDETVLEVWMSMRLAIKQLRRAGLALPSPVVLLAWKEKQEELVHLRDARENHTAQIKELTATIATLDHDIQTERRWRAEQETMYIALCEAGGEQMSALKNQVQDLEAENAELRQRCAAPDRPRAHFSDRVLGVLRHALSRISQSSPAQARLD